MAISQELVERLNRLKRLNQAAADVYQHAIDRIERPRVKASLTVFRDNHRRHVQELARLLHSYGVPPKPPAAPNGLFLKNVTMLPPLSGDERTLDALGNDEALVNERYRDALDVTDWPEDVRQVLGDQREDKARHLDWLERALAARVWETVVETETGVSSTRPPR